MTSLAKLRKKLLTDPEVKTAHDRLGSIFAMVSYQPAVQRPSISRR